MMENLKKTMMLLVVVLLSGGAWAQHSSQFVNITDVVPERDEQ